MTLPADKRVKVAEACCPPDGPWHWEIRADGPYEVWDGNGVHRKSWSPKHYPEHLMGLVKKIGRLILEDHRRKMKKLEDDYAGHLCIKMGIIYLTPPR